jgi:hypothetical protein
LNPFSWKSSESEYNDDVNSSLAKTTGLILLLLGAHAKTLQIKIPGERFRPLERIPAEIENRGRTPITFCVEFGQTSPTPDENGIEAMPSPFELQANFDGKWHTLLIGPDVGSRRQAEVLEPGESRPYPFRLRETGKIRIVLSYWDGSMPKLECGHPPKGIKRLESDFFALE